MKVKILATNSFRQQLYMKQVEKVRNYHSLSELDEHLGLTQIPKKFSSIFLMLDVALHQTESNFSISFKKDPWHQILKQYLA